MRETGYPDTNLKGKCHECYMYKPLVKTCHRTGIKTKFARGKCMYPNRKNTYRQRTETCKKFVKKSLIQGKDKGK